ncbi:MAG: FAD-binding oxidoreductase [Phycisphaeraceae bacterium]
MATVTFNENDYALAPGETVLDALLRHGVAAPYSCKSGTCQSCLMRVTQGTPPSASQIGLKDSLRARGFFLPCVCVPEADLAIASPDGADVAAIAYVVGTHRLSHDVVRLLLRPETPFEYRAGQFINLVREDGLIRSYSIASLPQGDEHLELHVRRIPGGRMSNWIHDDIQPGDQVQVRGPSGDCFYLPDNPRQDLLLVGTGTGLAPLYGIIRDALEHHHEGRIALYQGALDATGLYLVDELEELARFSPRITYTRCLVRGEPGPGVEVGSLDQIVLSQMAKLKGWRVYLCGNPELVQMLRKKAFLAGAAMKEIHSDAFIMAKS